MTLRDILDTIGRDVHRSLRVLSRTPTFTAAAVLTLALGIGATTAIFSVVDAVLIRPLPYPNSDELVSLRHRAPGIDNQSLNMSPTAYFTYRDESRTIEQLGLWSAGGRSVTGVGDPEQARAVRVTHGVLEAIGVQPMLGRLFTQEETTPQAAGAEPAIVSYAYWQRKFGGDEAIIGRTITVDGFLTEIVGVMPQDFRFLDVTPAAELISPFRLDRSRLTLGDGFGLPGIARLRPGVTPDEASADIERMLPIWLEAWPLGQGQNRDAIASWRLAPEVTPLKADIVGNVATMLWTLLGTIGGVLLIACANIANLTLVRGDARRQEFAIRAALGAGRSRIARELFIESLVLGVAGGTLGLLLAFVGLRAFGSLDPTTLPRLHEIGVDTRVLAFAIAASVGASFLFGTIPSIRHARLAGAAFGAGGRGTTATRERHATRNTLVVVQVALALVLIVSSGLMIRTFFALRDIDPGFTAPDELQVVRISITNLVTTDPNQVTQIQRDIRDRIAATPGVVSAAFASAAPLEANRVNNNAAYVEGKDYAGEAPPLFRFKFVSPGYFETMGTRLVAGRDITWTDIDNGGHVALVSASFARREWGDVAAALGKRIRQNNASENWHEVIGVVQNVSEDALNQEPPVTVYWPVRVEGFFGQAQFAFPAVAYVVRSERAGTESLLADIRQAIWSVNANLPVFLVRTIASLYAESLARTTLTLMLLGIAGAMALALGVVGIYGVIAYVVSQRAREIGIRLALGAQPTDVKQTFVRQGLVLATIGAAAGLAAAVALTRSIASLLYGIGPLDLPTYGVGLGLILAAAMLASYLPARRAASIDPVEALKAE